MRIKKEKIELDYGATKMFFNNRALKFNEENPYAVTMYQDNDKELVRLRNTREKDRILPLLSINKEVMLLDIGCGIGRWADAIETEIIQYVGIDLSEELINIAVERNHRSNFEFLAISILDIESNDIVEKYGKFNRIIVSGVLLYLNDDDVKKVIQNLVELACDHGCIYFREPIGINERLTLKQFFSEDLKDYYNAIYRTKEEYDIMFKDLLSIYGYKITEQGHLFQSDANLNNRTETSQYFYVFEK